MGKRARAEMAEMHIVQWLPNGNLLITESMEGREFEINSRREVVWEHMSYVEAAVVGIVEEVERIPKE
jgi:hypothetical protein